MSIIFGISTQKMFKNNLLRYKIEKQSIMYVPLEGASNQSIDQFLGCKDSRNCYRGCKSGSKTKFHWKRSWWWTRSLVCFLIQFVCDNDWIERAILQKNLLSKNLLDGKPFAKPDSRKLFRGCVQPIQFPVLIARGTNQISLLLVHALPKYTLKRSK